MKTLKELIITILSAMAILFFLKITGLLGSFSGATQSVIMQTGLLDAEVEVKDSEAFDYNFTIKDLNGNNIHFEQFKGKVVFINLWATWCGPCKAEMANIHELYKAVPHDSISFVLLSLDKDQHKSKVVKYMSDKEFTFPAYMPVGNLSDQLNVPSIPTTFIINKAGKIVAKEVGTTNFNTKKFKNFLMGLAS
jgi:thiol-disulfide isomerase/thioredoxin